MNTIWIKMSKEALLYESSKGKRSDFVLFVRAEAPEYTTTPNEMVLEKRERGK